MIRYILLAHLVFLNSLIAETADLKTNSLALTDSASSEFFEEGELPVNALVTKNCIFGDFDAIRQEMQFSKNKKLLISLEANNEDSASSAELFPEFSQPIKIKKSEEVGEKLTAFDKNFKRLTLFGENHLLKLPKVSKPELFWLKICKDSDNSESCKGKPVATAAEILKKYQKPKRGFIATDSTYFALPVVITAKEIKYFNEVLTAEKAKAFISKLKEWGVESKETPELSSLLGLQSIDFGIHNNHLQITLPSFDAVKCGQQKS